MMELTTTPAPNPRASRAAAGHTQSRAAQTISVATRTWQDWEAGVATMNPALLRLYRHLSGLERIPFRAARYTP